ncbi:MAG: hypothetical protein RLZZ612_1509 [Pseudomonadota bacterium]
MPVMPSAAVVSAAPPLEQSSMWASVEALRGIAALMVMVCHYYELMGISNAAPSFFYTGVNLFFVISGFVFGAYFFGKKIDAKKFVVRRFFRLYPLYIFSLLVYVILNYVQKDQFEVKYIFLHLFFLQNFYPEIRAVYNAAYWSLPVEVGFYAVVLAAVYLRWVNFKTVLMAALLYSVIVKVLFFNGKLSSDAVWIIACTTPLWLIDFLIGTGVFWVKDKIKHEKLVWIIFVLSVLAWVSLCVKWVALGGEHMLLLHPLLHTTYKLLVPLSFAGILLFLLKQESYFRGAFKKWAYALGAISYSVYLMHHVPPRVLSVLGFQVYNLTGLVISGLLTVFISFYLNRWIENRWIQMGKKIVN